MPKATEQILTEHCYPSGPTQTATQEGDQDHPPYVAHPPTSSSQVLGSCQAHRLPGPHSIGPASAARQGQGGKPWGISSSSCWSPTAPASGNVLLSSERRRPDTRHLGPSPHPPVPNNLESNSQESFIPCSVNKSLHTQVDHQVSSQTPPPPPPPQTDTTRQVQHTHHSVTSPARSC